QTLPGARLDSLTEKRTAHATRSFAPLYLDALGPTTPTVLPARCLWGTRGPCEKLSHDVKLATGSLFSSRGSLETSSALYQELCNSGTIDDMAAYSVVPLQHMTSQPSGLSPATR